MRHALLILALPVAGAAAAQDIDREIWAQTFTVDPSHTTVFFSVNHLGFSNYTAGFDDIAGTLELDPDAPEAAQLDVTIRTDSLDLPRPPDGFRELLLGPDWLDAGAHPEITFRSTSVTRTGDRTAQLTGDLGLKGATAPVTLEVTFNESWGRQPFEPHARVGFSASGMFRRSDFGVDAGLPPDGTTFGVGDEITVTIETELTGEPFE
ncbi:YceI family protein [Sulfitobacter sp. D35]|uniref:YceI family protein n=1 Tax=Sulfitobacter sp. D35 TaxID=3083252 RepID=UPI00296F0ED2|nr:YceI family protein [Sulfitobacter sp. D35]MDW4497632.1 YceI family protein [Sulfitobacter sp. D35]